MNLIALSHAFQTAYDAARIAKDSHGKAAAKFGDCRRISGAGWPEDSSAVRCYRQSKEPTKWCKSCKGRQPAWQLYRRLTRHKTAAMMRLLNATRKESTQPL